jgi:acyl dehydratase
MALDLARLKSLAPPAFEQRYGTDETILYALALGLGEATDDSRQLNFVYEADLRALPTMGLVLGDPGFWLQDPATGVDWPKVLYGEVSIDLHTALPTNGHVIGTTQVDEIVDKGASKGALLYVTREVTDRDSGRPLCTVKSTYLCRANGGFGGSSAAPRALVPMPARPADECVTLTTRPDAALLYRLTGDHNPLHADPSVARSAGFPRTVLHGLCTFGIAGHALLRTLCDYQTERVLGMGGRFVAPVYPGDTLLTEIWREGAGQAMFRCSVPARGEAVLSQGTFRYV